MNWFKSTVKSNHLNLINLKSNNRAFVYSMANLKICRELGRKVKKSWQLLCCKIFCSPELESWLREYSTEESDPETDSDRDGPPEKTIYNYNVKPRDPKFAGYWHIQNMFQFIKTGGHPPTLIGLCSILDMDLSQENVAMSIVEANGVEVLVNILEVPLLL